LADKAYDTCAILDFVEADGAQPVIPQRKCMPRKRAFDLVKYRLRNRIERTIGKLKQLRRIATRYDRIPQIDMASLCLAAISFWC
jgi:transposase